VVWLAGFGDDPAIQAAAVARVKDALLNPCHSARA